MQKVKYSVIIPIYNSEKTLRACVDSIINQNYSDFELILVNDGSVDSSVEICYEYARNNRNIVVVDKDNGGVSSARNAGIEIASGEYLLFVDSDDEVLPGYFSSLDEAKDCDFLVFGYDDVKVDGFFTKLPKYFNDGATYMTTSRDGGPCNKRYRRDIIIRNKICFPEDISIGEDFVFCVNYSLFCKDISFLNSPLYKYNNYIPGSLTRRPRDAYLFAMQSVRIYDYAFKALETADINEALRNELIRNLDYNYCRTAFASAMQPVIYKSETLHEDYKHIANVFFDGFNYDIKPKNLTHRIMRFCVSKKIKSVLYIVAVLKNLKDHILLRLRNG